MKTIAKNRIKVIENIFKNARCYCFSLNNNFSGTSCPAEAAKKDLFEFSFSKLRNCESAGKYVLRVHSNLWYELYI